MRGKPQSDVSETRVKKKRKTRLLDVPKDDKFPISIIKGSRGKKMKPVDSLFKRLKEGSNTIMNQIASAMKNIGGNTIQPKNIDQMSNSSMRNMISLQEKLFGNLESLPKETNVSKEWKKRLEGFLKRNNKILNKNLETNEVRVDSFATEYEVFNDFIKDIEKSPAQFKDEAFNNDIKFIKSALIDDSGMKKINDDREKQITDLKNQIIEINKDKIFLQKQFTDQSKKSKDVIEELKLKLGNAKSSNNEVLKQKSALELKNNALEIEIGKRKFKDDVIPVMKPDVITKDYSKLKTDFDEMTEDRDGLWNELSVMSKDKNGLIEELNEVKKLYIDMKSRFDEYMLSANNEIKELQARIQDSEMINKEREKYINNLEVQTSGQYANLKRGHEKDISDMTNNFQSEHHQIITNIQNEHMKEKSELFDTINTLELNKQTKEELMRTINQQASELENLIVDNNMKNERLSEYYKELERLSKENKDINDKIDEIKLYSKSFIEKAISASPKKPTQITEEIPMQKESPKKPLPMNIEDQIAIHKESPKKRMEIEDFIAHNPHDIKVTEETKDDQLIKKEDTKYQFHPIYPALFARVTKGKPYTLEEILEKRLKDWSNLKVADMIPMLAEIDDILSTTWIDSKPALKEKLQKHYSKIAPTYNLPKLRSEKK